MTDSAKLPSIGDLTNQLKHLAPSGSEKELKISVEAHQTCKNAILTFQSALNDQLPYIAACADYGNVGSLASANDTKKNLMTDAQVAHDTLHNYVHTYLEQLVTAVDSVFNRFQAQDQAS